MHLIVNGLTRLSQHSILNEILTRYGEDRCYIFYHQVKPSVPSNIDPIFLPIEILSEFSDYLPKDEKLLPLDAKIIQDMYKCESITLKMMDRIALIPGYFDHYNRKLLYLKHLQFWNHVLNKNKIDFVLFGNIPHEIYNYILYCLCLEKEIPVVMLFQLPILNSFMIYDKIDDPSLELKSLYENLLREYKNKDFNENMLVPRFREEFSRQTGKLDPHPHYMRKKTLIDKIKYYTNKIIQGKIKFKPFWIIKKRLMNFRLFNFYEKVAQVPDFEKKYIYLPLHFQPEMTTSPLAEIFVDQQLIIQLLSYCLPENVLLYIKENPKQTFVGRSQSFYEEILKLPNAILMKRDVNTFDLIRHSCAVATATGTVGWEALFREKPVLLFGNIFYQYVKGVFPIQTIDDCQNAIDSIFNHNFKPSLKNSSLFLKALESIVFEGIIDNSYSYFLDLSSDEINQNILTALEKKIQTFKEK